MREKSDRPIVAQRRGKPRGVKGPASKRFLERNMRSTGGWESMKSERQGIRELSEKHGKLETLMHYVSPEALREEHRRQPKGKAVGIDGETKESYEADLEGNIASLHARMRSYSYRPQPVRRAYIPKGNGKLRPLGIPAYEDRLVQGCMARILNEVYEPRFLGCSYGFREGRSAHDALREVNQILMTKRANYVLDCDIEGFFDNVDHGWMMRFLANDISDRSFLRYVSRFLKAGVMEEGKRAESDRGTPQGGLISPVLANVYLHYALDLWAVKSAFPKLKGEAHLVRYADDFIVMFQHESEARAFYEALKLRMARFGLKLAEDKTRILPFGRRKGTKETFDFLGFTHFNARTRTGKYTVGHRVAKKKMKQKKENIKKWIKENRTMPLASMLRALNVKLVGTFRYYGISGMFKQVLRIYRYAKYTAYKWLNRRSQRRSFRYSDFLRTWGHYVADPKVYTDIWGWKSETKSLV